MKSVITMPGHFVRNTCRDERLGNVISPINVHNDQTAKHEAHEKVGK